MTWMTSAQGTPVRASVCESYSLARCDTDPQPAIDNDGADDDNEDEDEEEEEAASVDFSNLDTRTTAAERRELFAQVRSAEQARLIATDKCKERLSATFSMYDECWTTKGQKEVGAECVRRPRAVRDLGTAGKREREGWSSR